MKKYAEKFLVTGLLAGAVWLLSASKVPCLFRRLLGVPCPGCGMTHALLSAMRGDLGAAFGYHAMFWSLPILYLYFLTDGKLFRNKRINAGVFALVALGFAANWAVKLCVGA